MCEFLIFSLLYSCRVIPKALMPKEVPTPLSPSGRYFIEPRNSSSSGRVFIRVYSMKILMGIGVLAGWQVFVNCRFAGRRWEIWSPWTTCISAKPKWLAELTPSLPCLVQEFFYRWPKLGFVIFSRMYEWNYVIYRRVFLLQVGMARSKRSWKLSLGRSLASTLNL